ACPKPVTEQPSLNKFKMPWIGLQWLTARKGPAASSHFEGGGFVRSNEDVDYPNLMYHFLPLAVRYDGQKADTLHRFQVHVGPMYSDTRGSVKLKSTDRSEERRVGKECRCWWESECDVEIVRQKTRMI